MAQVKVGVMPGRLEEFAVENGITIRELLEIADINHSGYDVKVDGVKVTDLDGTTVSDSTRLVLLVKQVKGNSGGQVKIGVMPGRLNEFALEIGITVAEALQLAELDPTGYDVKVDGVKVDPNTATITESTNLILLVKQVKGN